MFAKFFSALFVPAMILSSLVDASHVDKRSVGALTPLSKKTTVCNVLDYGAVADNKTDIGVAIAAAFTKCAKAGGATLYIPEGNYLRKLNIAVVCPRKLTTDCRNNRRGPQCGLCVRHSA
jgi:rhamnogalacturonan hydrolase